MKLYANVTTKLWNFCCMKVKWPDTYMTDDSLLGDVGIER